MKIIIVGWYNLIYPITTAKHYFEILGYDVYFLPLLHYSQKFSGDNLSHALFSFIKNIDPKMILWWNWETSKEALFYIKKNTKDIAHYLFNWDHPFCLTEWDNNKNRKITSKNIWDTCFVTGDCKLEEYIKSGSDNAYYLRMFADEETHFPEYDEKYECEVSFVCTNLYEEKDKFPGQLFDRKTFMQNLIDAGIDVKLYGPENLKNDFPDNYCGFIHFMENHKVFYNSKINICLHVTNDNKYFNERVGTILASGGLLFCDKVKGIEEILNDGVDCIFIDENNYVKQIKTILQNYEHYNYIKKNAIQTAKQKFSPMHWAKFIDKELQTFIINYCKDYSLNKCYTFANYKPKKISIIMTYFERIAQLINTLNTIEETKYPKELIEVICYDDRSVVEPCIINTSKYSYSIKIIYGEFERDESIINSTYSYNNAFKYINGEYLIIQNSECMHIGDIITYAIENIKRNNVISFPCWATANEDISQEIFSNRNNVTNLKTIVDTKWELLSDYPNEFKGWYNEKFLRPECLHFCNAMHIETFKKIGLFDRKFEKLLGFDDNNYAQRIMFNENIDIVIPEHNYRLFVVHQFHGKYNKSRSMSLFYNSYDIYRKISNSFINNFINKEYVSKKKVIDLTYYDILDKKQFIIDLMNRYGMFIVNLTINKSDENVDIKFIRHCLKESNFRLIVVNN